MVKGDPESVKQGSGAMMTLNMLNVFVQAAPRMQPRTLYNARSFFVPNERACLLAPYCASRADHRDRCPASVCL